MNTSQYKFSQLLVNPKPDSEEQLSDYRDPSHVIDIEKSKIQVFFPSNSLGDFGDGKQYYKKGTLLNFGFSFKFKQLDSETKIFVFSPHLIPAGSEQTKESFEINEPKKPFGILPILFSFWKKEILQNIPILQFFVTSRKEKKQEVIGPSYWKFSQEILSDLSNEIDKSVEFIPTIGTALEDKLIGKSHDHRQPKNCYEEFSLETSKKVVSFNSQQFNWVNSAESCIWITIFHNHSKYLPYSLRLPQECLDRMLFLYADTSHITIGKDDQLEYFLEFFRSDNQGFMIQYDEIPNTKERKLFNVQTIGSNKVKIQLLSSILHEKTEQTLQLRMYSLKFSTVSDPDLSCVIPIYLPSNLTLE